MKTSPGETQDRQQATISVNFDESDQNTQKLKYEVAECVETKTITTTTTTKRRYPPVFVRPRPLPSLDAKEYPLAQKPTPPEIANFSFELPSHSPDSHRSGSLDEDDDLEDESEIRYPRRQLRDQSVSDDTRSPRTPSRNASNNALAINADPTSGPFPQRRVSRRHASHGSGASKDSSTSRLSQHSRLRQNGSRRGLPTLNLPINSSSKKPSQRSSSKSAGPGAISDRLRRTIVNATKDSDRNSGFPATPDTSDNSQRELASQRPRTRAQLSQLGASEAPDSELHDETQPFYDGLSPSHSDANTVISATSVATPPITDNDAEPFADPDESLQDSIRASSNSRPINTVASQDASLPSPRLSPTLQASHLPHREDQDEHAEDELAIVLRNHHDSQNSSTDMVTTPDPSSETPSRALARYTPTDSQFQDAGFMDSRSMIETFDAMPPEMQSFMMYQFLRRCPRKTLHLVAGVVNPALKCDILKDLPLELTFHVLSYLNFNDLCRAAQVSKYWRNVIDSNETGWKDLFDQDGFALPPGELDRAIREGWGWQDPVGPEGCERDFSLHSRLTSTETELVRSATQATRPDPPTAKLRSKRKRTLHAYGSDRAKRRASTQDNVAKDDRTYTGEKLHRSEGPISAANAAAIAVPDPQLGLASLRRLHLFKSLYRRHFMIRKSWTSGKVKPSHVAFTAHPRHVITCLQFDEDKIITGSDDMFIHIYDTKTGKLRKKLEGHEGGVWALQYEGNVLVSGSTDRSVRVWDIEKGLCNQVFYGHTSTVRCLEILMPTDTGKVDSAGHAIMMPAKPLIITGSRDSQLRVWRLPESGSRRYIQTGPPANDADCPYFIRTLQGHSHSVRAIAAHADTLVSGSYDNTVRVWRISTGETVHVLQGHTQKVYSVVLDTARNRCISGSMDSFVKIWDLDTGSCLYTLEGHSLLVGLLDLRDDRLVSAAADSTLRIWDPENGRCHSALTAHTGAITCFQHDGRKVISGSDRSLKMWDIKTGECLQDLLTDLGGVWQVRFDERRCIAAVQRDGLTYIEILDFGAVRDGKPLESLGKRTLLNPTEVQRIQEEDQTHTT